MDKKLYLIAGANGSGKTTLAHELLCEEEGLTRILKEARDRGYEVNMYYVFLKSLEFNVGRVKNRVLGGGHNVPEVDIIRRFYKSMKNFWTTIAFVDAWRLYYNGIGGHELIATDTGNDVRVYNEELYEEFKKESKNGCECC